ncbi:MAG: 50S ribosomal protein L18 [Verrucomicrobia bacterium]|nr:50S ribosomal protein L18 [Verrucomicrobiota bacterium]
MDNSLKRRKTARASRLMRVRKALRGSSEKPRLSVFKSNQHIYAQLIDDEKGVTLAGVGSVSKSLKGTSFNAKSKESAREVGTRIAEMAKSKNVSTVIFDRGRCKFHGIVAELANAAREAGLQF